jgi:hypothetical protein
MKPTNENSLFGRLYVGTVEDVSSAGTEHRGEARVRVLDIDGGPNECPTELLPWAVYFQRGFGYSFGTLSVGAKVLVEYQNGDPHCPLITAVMLDLSLLATFAPEFEAQFPNVYGFCDTEGNLYVVNRATGAVRFQTKNGFVAAISGTDINITCGTANVVASTGVNLTVGGSSVQVSGSKIKMTAPMIEEN